MVTAAMQAPTVKPSAKAVASKLSAVAVAAGAVRDTGRPSAADVTELAHSLGYVTEEELQALGDFAPTTVETRRKRGQFPAYVRFGSRYYYALTAVREYFATLSREPAKVNPASQL